MRIKYRDGCHKLVKATEIEKPYAYGKCSLFNAFNYEWLETARICYRIKDGNLYVVPLYFEYDYDIGDYSYEYTIPDGFIEFAYRDHYPRRVSDEEILADWEAENGVTLNKAELFEDQ